jgi:hypothetical protein
MQDLGYRQALAVPSLPTPSAALAGVTVRLISDNKPYWCDGTSWVLLDSQITLAAAQATTSGTFKDFTIPSFAKRITLTLSDVSTNGSAYPLVQLGTSGGIKTSGYTSTAVSHGGTNSTGSGTYSQGFGLVNGWAAGYVLTSTITLTLADATNNVWMMSEVGFAALSLYTYTASGNVALSGPITTVRFTTQGGTNTFDNGFCNVMCEG